MVDAATMAVNTSGNVSAATMTPSGDLSRQRIAELQGQLEMTRFVVMKILVPIFLSVGVTGNLINIAVLTRRWMRSSTNYYLTILAVYDVLYLIFAFTLILKHYTDVSGLKWYNYYKYHVGIPVTNTCSNTGVWLTLTFTLERYIAVCHPMRGKALCTPQRAKYIIIGVCSAAAILTVPDFFSKRVEERTLLSPDGQNITTYAAKSTDLAKRASFSVGYSYLTQVLFTFLPLILLMVFNSLLIRAVIWANRQRRAMANTNVVQHDRQGRHSRDQHRITIMLIAVVIVFLLCQSPQAIQNIMFSYYAHNGALTTVKLSLFTITANVFNLFVIINASVNFVLYSAFSTKFRLTFSRLFCRHMKRHRASDMFSDSATAMTTVHGNIKPTEDSHKHLIQSGGDKGPVTYIWPRSGTRPTNKSVRNNHMTRSITSNYNCNRMSESYTSMEKQIDVVSCF